LQKIGAQTSAVSASSMSPTDEQNLAASDALELLRGALGCPCHVVGSLASGLSTDASDVDIVVRVADHPCGDAHPVAQRDFPTKAVLAAIYGDDFYEQNSKVALSKEQRKRLTATLQARGFVGLEVRRGSPLLRMQHEATGVVVDVWCDVTRSVESLAEMRVRAARDAVAACELARVLHRVLRLAVGHELRVLEAYAAPAGGAGLGSYVMLLLVLRHIGRCRLEGDPTAVHDGGAATGAMLLSLLADLGGLASLGAALDLDEPAPLCDLPDLPPITLHLAPLPKGRSYDKYKISLHSSSVKMLSSLANALSSMLNAGIPLTLLLSCASPERTHLVAVVKAELGKHSQKKVEAATARCGAMNQRMILPPTSSTLAVLGGLSNSGSMPRAEDDSTSQASFFTSRWLPNGLLESSVAGSVAGSSSLNRHAPAFVPGQRYLLQPPS